jgi:hypothetical protein
MSIKYKKNPETYKQPDLFEEEDTYRFVPMEDLTEEQLKSLPRSAFSSDEWEELDEDIKVHILVGGNPNDPNLKRLDFDEDDWEELPGSVQEFIYENDTSSKQRVKSLAELIAGIVTSNHDEDQVMDYSESVIDHYMGDAEWLWNAFGEEVKDWADEEMGEGNYDEEELENAATEHGLTFANADFSITSAHNGDISAEVPGFYLDQYGLEANLSEDQINDMTDDEIERAIDHADDIDSNVSYEGLDASDFRRLFDGERFSEIQKDSDYESYAINIDWNWDGVWDSIRDAMDWEPGAPMEQFVEHVPEDRVAATLELSDGVYNVIDLLPGELKRETKKMNHCVGKTQFGYADAIRSGRTRILSVRPDGGENVWKRTITMEVTVSPPDNTSNIKDLIDEDKLVRIVQMKGTRNRVPGFERPLPGQRAEVKDFNKPDEFKNMVEVANALGFVVDDVPDLQPGFHAYKAMKTLPGPKRNPGRRPIYIQMPSRTFDMPAEY